MLKATVVAITLLIVSTQGSQNPYGGGYPGQYAPPQYQGNRDPYGGQQQKQYGAPPPGQFPPPPQGYPGGNPGALAPYGRSQPPPQPQEQGGGLFAK